METTKNRISQNKTLIIYIIVFYTIWALFEFFGKPIIDDLFPGVISSKIVKDIIIVLYPLVSAYLRKGSLSLRSDFGAKEIIAFSFVGITEEMVFRGWLLNAIVGREKKNQWKAILLNSLLFVAINIPTWIIHGEFAGAFLHFRFVTIIILSAIFSITFLKSRNILVPVALHMIWDFLLSMV